jgi:hypothetical protein
MNVFMVGDLIKKRQLYLGINTNKIILDIRIGIEAYRGNYFKTI